MRACGLGRLGVGAVVQFVSDTGSAQRLTTLPSLQASGGELDRYRADWRSSTPAVDAERTPSQPTATSNDPIRTNRNALLAADVYAAQPDPPAGTRVASDADLQRLGLTPDMLEQPGVSSFRARVYVSGANGNEQYTIAFRGTQSGDDWKANLSQGTGQGSIHYRNALAIGRQIARSGADVEMTGHSLGGGLASAAALAAGRHADTFNAAGLHDSTVSQATTIVRSAGQSAGAVDNYRVPGEILTFVQEGGDRLLGGVFGGIVGAIVVDAPPAFGRQHDLPLVVPADKGFFAEHSRIDRHGMDWVLASTAARVGR